jgi:L-arabinose isomerase
MIDLGTMGLAPKVTGRPRPLVRAMKVMSSGLAGGTSFMKDYTYDFGRPAKVLGAHMLEICPSIAAKTPSCEIHPLSIVERPTRYGWSSQLPRVLS